MAENKNETGEPAYTPIDSLPASRQENIRLLESQTDDIYRLRRQLAGFLWKDSRYFRIHAVYGEREDGSTEVQQKKYSIGEIYDGFRAEKDIGDFINWEKVDADAPLAIPGLLPEEADLCRQIYRDEIRAELEIGVEKYGELAVKGGIWHEGAQTGDQPEIRAYYRMRWGELQGDIESFQQSDLQREELEQKLETVKSLWQRTSKPALLRLINGYEAQLTAIQKTDAHLVETHPEAYIYYHARQLAEAKQAFDAGGRIIETPYVKRKIRRVMGILAEGRPVFLHGELGTGKTEFLRHIARTRLSAKHIERWTNSHPSPMMQWEADHPKPAEEADVPAWALKSLAARQSLEQEQKAWEAERDHQREPLFLPGHRGMEADQMIGSRTIRRAEAPTPAEQAGIIDTGWEEYRNRMLAEAEQNGSTDPDSLIHHLDEVQKPIYVAAYHDIFRSPVVAEVCLGPLLTAMREGRPYIEDEMNAIPHHLQIVKNDLILRKTGDWVQPPIPGAEPFRVRDGFAFMGSGNYKPEDGKLYVGRQEVDAAYISRFGLVEYDYLPNQRTREPPDPNNQRSPGEIRTFRAENELYHMLVSRLMEDDLSVTLPEDGFKKIGKLAMVARNLEDVFSGQNTDKAWYAKGATGKVKPQDVLKENVLSIRHLLPVLDAWKRDGYKRDLDYYLFINYVDRSSARPEEKKYLYDILRTQGDFFPGPKGWPELSEESDVLQGRVTVDGKKTTVEELLYGRDASAAAASGQLKMYSVREVVEELFGPAPVRTELPSRYLAPENPAGSEPAVPEAQLAEAREREALAQQLETLARELAEKGYIL